MIYLFSSELKQFNSSLKKIHSFKIMYRRSQNIKVAPVGIPSHNRKKLNKKPYTPISSHFFFQEIFKEIWPHYYLSYIVLLTSSFIKIPMTIFWDRILHFLGCMTKIWYTSDWLDKKIQNTIQQRESLGPDFTKFESFWSLNSRTTFSPDMMQFLLKDTGHFAK